jgi:hypothetical protein
MRDEELDWEIYHALADGKARTVADLAACGYDPALAGAALARLEKAHLVECDGASVRVLSFQESLLLCQLMHEEGSPLVLGNGVIRVRTGGERRE